MKTLRHLTLAAALLCAACSTHHAAVGDGRAKIVGTAPFSPPHVDAFIDTLERRTFDFFWETTNPRNGLTPDRWPTPSFSSIAAVGFALSAYPVGVERGYITRAQAAERTLRTLSFFWSAPQGPGAVGMSGYKGFFYHVLDMETGQRYRTTELSNIDTALLLAGVLTAQSYFDAPAPAELSIRAYADSLYRRVDWTFFQTASPGITMGWHPEKGYIPRQWTGYDESMILHLLALGSPTHPLQKAVWDHFVSSYRWSDFYRQSFVNFAPLFGHQYSHAWIDFRGIRDEYMRGRGIDYFENSRRATISQREYARDNPGGWTAYGADVWGLTASDGPMDDTLTVGRRLRRFHTYWARGAAADDYRDDGTLAPTAAGASIAFAPELAVPALKAMRDRWGGNLFTKYGFLDAFNPSLQLPIRSRRGRVVPGVGWFDADYLGIDQGPIVLMIENYRSELIWRVMRKNEAIVRGLCRAGFTGGWLTTRC